MAWQDRLVEAAYTSPSGERLTFEYEDVSKSQERKTTGFEFPDADGTFVQDLGNTGRRIPIPCIFWGDDYDLEADAFEAALFEPGVGRLEHPIYGTVDVVPFGTIGRQDRLKTAANQATVTVTFWETIGIIYPTIQDDPTSAVLSSIDEYNVAAAAEFEDVTDLDSAVEQASFKNTYDSLLNSVSSGMEAIAATQADVQKQFDAITSSINQGIDILVKDPLTLASQTLQMIQAPARALTSIQARLDAYGNLANGIIDQASNIFSQGNDSTNSNAFHTNDLYASTYVTGSMVSVVNNEFLTRTEALAAAEVILNQFTDIQTWRDANYESLGEIDTGSAYQQLQEAVAITAGFLVQISFSLKQERSIVLTRNRTIVDLAAELYGSIDDQLDFLINSNDLTGSDILELPKGRTIVYYV